MKLGAVCPIVSRQREVAALRSCLMQRYRREGGREREKKERWIEKERQRGKGREREREEEEERKIDR